MTNTAKVKAIFWGIVPGSVPPTYEILFPAELDGDHRVASAPYAGASDDQRESQLAAYAAFGALTDSDLKALSQRSEYIDREKLGIA